MAALLPITPSDLVNSTSHVSHSMKHSMILPMQPVNQMTMKADTIRVCSTDTGSIGGTIYTDDETDVDIGNKEHRITMLSMLVLCIGQILVWLSSSPVWSYSPSSVKKRPPKSFRKRFPGWKRSKWVPIALFLSSLCVQTQGSQYSTLAVSIASQGDSGTASSTAVEATLLAASAAAVIGGGDGGTDEEECTVEWCEKKLNSIKNEDNKHVIDYIIEVILPQVKAGAKIVPIFIGLCPTPERRGHESLGGKGRRDPERKTALSIRLMRLLNKCLPTREQGGIDSENPDISNGFWVNARVVCTDDGVTCNECRSWRRHEANAIGAALCILSKCVKHYGGQTVAINVSGVSVNTHYIFDYLRENGKFDGLSENGTHISKLGSKCRSWTKSYQCNMAASTLAAIDNAFKSSFEQIEFKPSLSFLQMGLQNPLFKYVTESGNVATFAETCADCGACDATVVDMLQMESSTVNESSFNEGQDEEEDDDHECSDDGDNIACCMVCDKCAQTRAHVDEYDDEGNFMPISEFRQESKRAARRERDAAQYAKLKEDPDKYEEHLAAQRERDAARRAKLKEDPEKYEEHVAAQRERDAARYAKLKEDPEKLEKRKAAKHEYDAARYVKKIKLAKYVISTLDDNIGALYNAASVNCAARWAGLSKGPINKALKGDGLISYRGTELYRIREAAPNENLAIGMTEAGEMNWHYSVDVPATWSSDCTDEDVGALALLFP